MKLQDVIELNPKLTLKKGVLVPFIEMAALPTNEKCIVEVAYRAVTGSGAKFQNGDTLFARITPCLENGKGGYVAGLPLGAVGQGSTEFIVFRARKKSDEQFAYYLTRYSKFRNFAEKGMVGTSGRQRVTWQTLADFELPNLAKSQRAALGEILASLDDKIELNRRMNETLEEMARALFRDWFVDFGPTRRQMAGETSPAAIMGQASPPEKAAPLAPLFPTTLGDDGLPDGWETRGLRSALTLNYGKSLTKKARKPGRFNVFGSGGVSGTHDTALAKGPSIIVGRKGTVGSLYWTREDFYAIDTVFYVTSDYPMVYCHRLLETLGLETMNTDAAVPGLNRDNAYRQEFAFGGDDLVKAYADFAGALTEKLDANEQENQTLAALRDLLLPKLMSGEIRLKDAEAAL